MRDWPDRPIPRYRVAVLLDRDGTINIDTHYVHRVEELEFIPGALEGLKILGKLPVHIIVVSNQAGIMLGKFTREDMSRFNSVLRNVVKNNGGRIDAFYYCPHKEAKHLSSGEQLCECSKPKPGMLFEAAKDYSFELNQSFMIGDKSSDIEAGKAAGCSTILVKTGKAGREVGATLIEPDLIAPDLLYSAKFIKEILKEKLSGKAREA